MMPKPTPLKYQQVYDSLTRGIRSGDLDTGQKLPADDAMMKEYGVSRNTIIKAVSMLVSDGLVRRVHGSGTYVQEPEQPVPEAERVAFIANGEFDYASKLTVFGRIEEAIAVHLSGESGMELVPMPFRAASAPASARRDFVAKVLAGGIRGAFLLPSALTEVGTGVVEDEAILGDLEGAEVPVVLLDRDTSGRGNPRVGHDLIGLDNPRAGLELGRHLMARGAERVLFLSFRNEPRTLAERFAGLKEAFSRKTAVLEKAELVDMSEEEIADAIAAFQPDCVVAKDDSVAARAMRVLYRQGIRVPDDVAVAGFDDSPIAAELMVPLTTYAQPVSYIARCAVQLLRERIAEPLLPVRRIAVAGELIVRASTARPVAAAVAAAR